jgi:ubiquinone/menaquinone biosynthesis C-methylase UbiE/uncharacterized protein YbaR (Trm112 family)
MSAEAGLGRELLDLLCCPITHAPLRLENGELVSTSSPPQRYVVHDGIPIFLGLPAQDAAASRIALAFCQRSTTYFSSNYQAGGNLARIDRLRITLSLLQNLARSGMRILDVGAGPAILAETCQRLALDYVALDLSLENLLQGRQRAGSHAAIVGDVAALPIRDESFDIVVALGCLEYTRSLDQAVAELSRVVKRGGRVLATFANARSARRQWQERVRHPVWRVKERLAGRGSALYRRYLSNEGSVREMFGQQGLAVERVVYLGNDARRFGVSRSERRASEFLLVGLRQ